MAKIHVEDADWFFFTSEERSRVQSLIDAGRFGDLSAVVNFGDPLTSHGKELVLQKIQDQGAPLFQDYESKVRKELDKYLSKGGKIETKEDEERWQARLRDEAQEYLAKSEDRKKEREERLRKKEEKVKEVREKLKEKTKK